VLFGSVRTKAAHNVGEIYPLCQFHQHFTGTFLPIFLRQKIAKPNIIREKLLNLLLYKKCAHKMLMKLTPGQMHQCFTTSFCPNRSQKGKKDTDNLTVFFALLVSSVVKAASKIVFEIYRQAEHSIGSHTEMK